MKTRISKKLIILVILALLATMIGGCTSTTPNDSSSSSSNVENSDASSTTQDNSIANSDTPSYLSDTSPITFDWYVDEAWYTRVNWGEDIVSKNITEKTGVTLNLIIPSGDTESKKNLMLASGDIPDLVNMGWWLPQWKQMAEAGYLWSYDELAEQYEPNFFDDTYPSTVNWYRDDNDGKLYAYPNSSAPLEIYEEPGVQIFSKIGMSVRKDMYEALGKPDMRTPEGFLDALRKAKEMYPEVNGQPIIPFLLESEFTASGNGSIDDILPQLLNIPRVKDGIPNKYNMSYDDEMVIWLKTLRKATEEGLILKDNYTDQQPQLDEKMKSGRVFATLCYTNSLSLWNGQFYAEDPESVYMVVDGPSNSKLEVPKLEAGGISGWHVTVASKKTANPERLIKFLHYYISQEGQEDFFYGTPEMYDVVDGKKVMKDDIYRLFETDEVGFSRKYGGRDAYFMMLGPLATNVWRQDIPSYLQATIDWSRDKNTDISEMAGIEPIPNTEAGIALGNSSSKWSETLLKILTAKSDAEVDELISQYKQTNEKNSEIYMPVLIENYNKNKARLGK